MALQTEARVERPDAQRRWVFMAIAVLAAIAVAAVFWFVASGDDTPTATFDGQTVTYEGPTSFDAGNVAFKFDVSQYETGVIFGFLPVGDDSLTADDLKAELDGAYVGEGGDPEWFDPKVIPTLVTVQGETEDDRIMERSIPLKADTRYVLVANTFPTDGWIGHWGALIEVE
jgi:hypothetical protein